VASVKGDLVAGATAYCARSPFILPGEQTFKLETFDLQIRLKERRFSKKIMYAP